MLIYDERGGMVAVYDAPKKWDCLELPADSFIFVRYFKRDAAGGFVRDDEACVRARLIAAGPTMRKEIWETMERLDSLVKRKPYDGDEYLVMALSTMLMDLGRAYAIADGTWPTLPAASLPRMAVERPPKPSTDEIVARIVKLQEEADAKVKEFAVKPLMGRDAESRNNLRNLDFWSSRFQALMDVKFFVDPDTSPKSTAMDSAALEAVRSMVSVPGPKKLSEDRLLGMLEACRDVCMYCGNRVPGYGPAEGPNEAGNYVHSDTVVTTEKRTMLCAASSVWHRIRRASCPICGGGSGVTSKCLPGCP